MDYDTRLAEAKATCDRGMKRVKTEPEPAGQKFPNGSRVRIADDLGSMMSHFISGVDATVGYTYAHAFGQTWDDSRTRARNAKTYSLILDGGGSCAWYHEDQLTALERPASAVT